MLGQDLDAVLREVIPEGRKAVIVGHSMGGMTIMSWAAQFPDRVADVASSVVLTSTAAQAVVQKNALIPANLPRYTTAFKSVVSKVFVSATVPLPRKVGEMSSSENSRASDVRRPSQSCSPRFQPSTAPSSEAPGPLAAIREQPAVTSAARPASTPRRGSGPVTRGPR